MTEKTFNTTVVDQHTMTTTFFISNLHCPSCITSIETSLDCLSPPPISISHSIISHSITVRHDEHLTADTITEVLEKAGFEVYSVAHGQNVSSSDWQPEHTRNKSKDWGLEQAVNHWKQAWKETTFDDSRKRKRHMDQCLQCQSELRSYCSSEQLIEKRQPNSTIQDFAVSENASDIEKGSSISLNPVSKVQDTEPLALVGSAQPEIFHATFSIGGMTCSACVGNVSRAISQNPWVQDVNVVLLSNSATVTFSGKGNEKHVIESVDDAGYDITLEDLENKSPKKPQVPIGEPKDSWTATFSITGMTCSACVSAISNALEQPDWIEDVHVNLISNSATVAFNERDRLEEIREMIEDLGYDASIEDVQNSSKEQAPTSDREVALRVEGMFCHHCPERILQAISEKFDGRVHVEGSFSTSSPMLRISYRPQPTALSLRQIVRVIDAVDTDITAYVYHAPTVEERSKEIQAAERRKILLRLILSFVVAIPTFIIGIVYMTLVSPNNSVRRYLMQPMWAGHVARAEWALFIMGTAIYFFAADLFHIRTLEGLRAMWRPGSPVPLADRFYRFGNMNMLISLGTSVAYFASIAALAINATHEESSGDGTLYYFDSVVFLTMFLLAGRFLEAHSKAKTGDAVTALGSLRPSEALLVSSDQSSDSAVENTATDLLEVGDVVRVPHGSSPPFDGIIVSGETKFDESSLTGEARLINKLEGDAVYSGTINKGTPTSVRLTSISGTSMLDQIIKVVREGQTRRAPVERVADVLTSHFVPFVVLIGIATWIIWLVLGLSGALPDDYRDTTTGGWPFWSLQFSIAVFVVACPCGIGLAAPTALFVGGGLAAKHGILVKGGGEAFQEASMLDCVVFDKTGTLTEGGQPAVTECKIVGGKEEHVLGMVRSLEENSSHPIARSIVEYSKTHKGETLHALDVEEIPGRGMKGCFGLNDEGRVTAIIGNEALMSDFGVDLDQQTSESIEEWKQKGMSIALLSTSDGNDSCFRLSAAFAISDPIRAEAADVVRSLQRQGLAVWLVSGDNATTANGVGAAVGIPASNIMAGVLPEQKADKIKFLQRTLPAKRSRGWLQSGGGKNGTRATVAMVGDGINDAPALAMADVGVAIGSGSDVALSTASFVLVSSDLHALVRLIQLSRAVFRRVWLNFAWALMYNMIALPVAAGAFYAINSGGGHVRLDPVWASLAMALSSVSVVSSSLALRTRIPFIGFRAE